MKPPYSRTLGDLLSEQADRYESRTAVICGTRTVSYRELYARATLLASWLQAKGIAKGDRVGLLMNNRVEWLEVFFAANMIGAVIVACSTWSRRDELDYLIGDSSIKMLITVDEFAGQNFVEIVTDLLSDVSHAGDAKYARYPLLEDVVVLGDHAPSGWTAYSEIFLGPHSVQRADQSGGAAEALGTAVIIYTSGSSSRPKSVPLANYGIIENGFNIGERQGYGPEDRVLLAPPLFWSYGSANAMSATLTHGAALVLQGRFEAGEALDLIEQHRCTALYTLPNITSALVTHPKFKRERTASLRTGLTIGAPQDVRLAAETLGAAEICNVYGQTESYGNCCVTWHHWPLEQRMVCQGQPLPGVTIRIVDPESGQELQPGIPGAIEVRGYVTSGYIDASAEQNRDAWSEQGFFRTGDLGSLGSDGALRFLGRSSEMIKKDGINVSPAEVEDVLMRHPLVVQAGVVGVPHKSRGELIAAYVMTASSVSASDLQAHCRQLVSRYKIPDFIEFRNALPATATGKLLRRELKLEARSLQVES